MTKADDCVMNGRVKSWDNNLRSGFITSETGEEVVVLINDIDGHSHLVKGQRVQFRMSKNKKGLKARDVKVLSDEPIVSSSGENNYFQNEVSPSTETAEKLQRIGESSEGKYIELYIDETGNTGRDDEDFIIGGVYAIHPSMQVANEFNYDLAKKGNCHFKSPLIPDVIPDDSKIKIAYPKTDTSVREKNTEGRKKNIEEFLQIRETYHESNFGVIQLICEKKINKKYENNKHALNLFMLRYLIELFLYELLPVEDIKRGNSKISIYAATRVEPHHKDICEEKRFRYGIEYTQNDESRYITPNTPYLLMQEIGHLHFDQYLEDMYRILGVKLTYKKCSVWEIEYKGEIVTCENLENLSQFDLLSQLMRRRKEELEELKELNNYIQIDNPYNYPYKELKSLEDQLKKKHKKKLNKDDGWCSLKKEEQNIRHTVQKHSEYIELDKQCESIEQSNKIILEHCSGYQEVLEEKEQNYNDIVEILGEKKGNQLIEEGCQLIEERDKYQRMITLISRYDCNAELRKKLIDKLNNLKVYPDWVNLLATYINICSREDELKEKLQESNNDKKNYLIKRRKIFMKKELNKNSEYQELSQKMKKHRKKILDEDTELTELQSNIKDKYEKYNCTHYDQLKQEIGIYKQLKQETRILKLKQTELTALKDQYWYIHDIQKKQVEAKIPVLGIVPLQRPMHYVADSVVGSTADPEQKVKEMRDKELYDVAQAIEESYQILLNAIKEGKLIKIQETYDDKNLPKFINASRLLDQGKYLEALEEVINEEWPNEQDKEKKMGRYYILKRLGKKACPKISNEDFYHLVSICATESKSKNGNSTTS